MSRLVLYWLIEPPPARPASAMGRERPQARVWAPSSWTSWGNRSCLVVEPIVLAFFCECEHDQVAQSIGESVPYSRSFLGIQKAGFLREGTVS